MKETNLMIQNRLREATVSLERANMLVCDETWKCDSSVPPFSSIGLIMQGEGTICVNGRPIHPAAGQMYLLPANTNQSFFTNDKNPYRKYFCHFEITCQQTDLFELLDIPLCVDAKNVQQAQTLFQDMMRACDGGDILSALKGKQAVLNLLCYYLECCPPDSISMISESFDSPLSLAIAYVEAHLDRQVTVQEMAAASGYHTSHFTKLFQARMGMPPGQFILQKRAEKAAHLLTSTELSISAIADSLGFGSPFYFSNFFKRHTGMTPSLYRSIYRRAYLQK